MNFKIEVAPHAGYCYGVERAINMAKQALKEGKDVVSLGPIIHNPIVVDELENMGLRVVGSVDEVPEGSTVVIRSHGVPPEVYEVLKEKNARIIDATCPYVRRAQIAAQKLSEEGYRILIVGEKDHPEVIGIKGYAGNGAIIVEDSNELKTLPFFKRLGVVFQTTQSLDIVDEIASEVVKKAYELKVFNTICSATTNRQNATKEIAKRADVVVVVGGRNSGNTKRLFEIARKINERTYHVEAEEELKVEWFRDARTVGITAGASTPKELIVRVSKAVESIVKEER